MSEIWTTVIDTIYAWADERDKLLGEILRLRSRVEELEERLADEFVTRRAAEERLAAWKPVVRAAITPTDDPHAYADNCWDAGEALADEHRPEVEP